MDCIDNYSTIAHVRSYLLIEPIYQLAHAKGHLHIPTFCLMYPGIAISLLFALILSSNMKAGSCIVF